MTQFLGGVKDMMTNALPRDSLQVIGFLLHQNQRFIDHDKVVRPGQCFINGQKRDMGSGVFLRQHPVSHLQLNKFLK